MQSKEVESLVLKLAKSEKKSAQIGLMLRDTYGIPSVKAITGKRINQILKDNNLNYLLITGVRWIGDDTFIVRAYYPDKVNLQYEVNLKTKLITEIK